MAATVLHVSAASHGISMKISSISLDKKIQLSPENAVLSLPRANAAEARTSFFVLRTGMPVSTCSFSLRAKANTQSTPDSPPKISSESSKVVVIDNYDSFTYNLCQYLGDLGCDYEVLRNDDITVDELKAKRPRGILISPGPGSPKDSGISLQSILELGSHIPVFGVCMGLQCMGEAFGGKIVRAPNGVVHGKTSLVYYDEKGEDGLLAGLPNPFVACRYHSLVIERESFPSDELEITAWTEDGLIMGVRHLKYRHIQGVQFHPESIITEKGKMIVANFLKILEQNEAVAKEDENRVESNVIQQKVEVKMST